jgi:hypothetical protein
MITTPRPLITGLIAAAIGLASATTVTASEFSGVLPPLPEDPRSGFSIPLETSPRLDLSAPFAVELTTSNDIIGGEDDLYTADLAFTAVLDGFAITLNEHMFTDREAGRRHDETVVEFRRMIPELWGLDGEIALGALRVGRGLFGESLQNAVHNVFDNDEVELAYPEGIDWYASVRLRVGADIFSSDAFALRADGVAATAPGFRSKLEGRLAAGHKLRNGAFVEGGVGVMLNHVETDLLRDHVDDVVPTWSVAVGWGPVALQWSANTFGTTQRHIGFVYRFGANRDDAGIR